MWLEDGQCKDVVEEAWERGQNKISRWPLKACLEECQRSLESWNKHTFDHVGKQIAVLQNKLQELESMNGRLRINPCSENGAEQVAWYRRGNVAPEKPK